MKLFKSFTFEAAHYLPNLPKEHKCRRIHGHSFRCDIEIEGPLNEELGWVMDFADVKQAYGEIYKTLDHHFLNEDVPGLENPTSENIAIWIWKKLKPSLPLLYSVTIHETCTSKCQYLGD